MQRTTPYSPPSSPYGPPAGASGAVAGGGRSAGAAGRGGASVTDRAMDHTVGNISSIASKFSFYPFILGMVAMPFAWLSGLAWLPGATALGTVAAWLGAPQKFMSETKIGDLATGVTALREKAEGKNWSTVAEKLGSIEEPVQTRIASASASVGSFFNGAAEHATAADSWLGNPLKKLSGFFSKRAQDGKQAQKLNDAINGIMQQIGTHSQEKPGELQALWDALGNTQNALKNVNSEESIKLLQQAFGPAELKGSLYHHIVDVVKEGSTASPEAQEIAKKFVKEMQGGFFDGGLLKAADKTVDRAITARHFDTKNLKNMKQFVSELSLSEAAMGTAAIAGNIYQGHATIKQIMGAWSGLQDMNRAITGKNKSIFGIALDVVTGKAPPMVSQAFRQQVFGIGGRVALQVFSIWQEYRSLAKHKHAGFMVSMGVHMGGGMLVDALTKGSTLDAYVAFSNAHAAGEKISAQSYAQLILLCNPSLKSKVDPDDAFAFAQECAAKKLPASKVMGLASNTGQFLAAAKQAGKVKATEAAAQAAQHQAMEGPAAGEKQVLGQHTAKALGKAASENYHPVVGQQTAMQAQRDMAGPLVNSVG